MESHFLCFAYNGIITQNESEIQMRLLVLGLLILISIGLLTLDTVAQDDLSADGFIFIGVDPNTNGTYYNRDIYYIRVDGTPPINLTKTEFDSENKAYWKNDGSGVIFSRNSVVTEENGLALTSTSFWQIEVDRVGNVLGEQFLFDMQEIYEIPMRVENWYLSPDQTRIFFSPLVTQHLYIVDLQAPSLNQLLLPEEQTIVTAEDWLDNETVLYSNAICPTEASGACDSEYWAFNLSEQTATPTQYNPMIALENSEVELTVSYTFNRGFTLIWDGLSLPLEDAITPDLSPDGETLAYIQLTGEQTAALMIIKRGVSLIPQTLIYSRTSILEYPSWSADGSLLAFYGYASGDMLTINIIAPDGSNAKTLMVHPIASDMKPVQWRPIMDF